jgi:hypothetical protein
LFIAQRHFTRALAKIPIIKKIINLLLIILVLQGCSYRMVDAKTMTGEIIKIKEYKDPKIEHKVNRNIEFDYYRSKFEQLSCNNRIDSIQDWYLIESDTFKIYLFKDLKEFLPLFVDNKICAIEIYKSMTINPFITRWEKNTLSITDIEVFRNVDNQSNQKKYELQAYLGVCPCFGPSAQHFLFELTLNKSESNSFKNINFIKYGQLSAFGNPMHRESTNYYFDED